MTSMLWVVDAARLFQAENLVALEKMNDAQQKTNNLFKVFENSIKQRCVAHTVRYCQQYCSALLSLN